MTFDDDDEGILANMPAPAPAGQDDQGAVMEDALEDAMPDYKLFASTFEKKGVSGKSIRRGEKDYESHGTRAQDSALESSRKAMEEVLSYTRTHRADAWIRGWFFPDWCKQQSEEDSRDPWLRHRVVVVEHEKGNWMKDIGRTVPGNKQDQPGLGKLWLLPEEALYLVERGTLDLWWPDVKLQDVFPSGEASARPGFGPDDYDVGLPLSLEGAYSLLVGLDGVQGKTSLPKYQVFTHLKRAGFHVMRAPPASRPTQALPRPPTSVWQWLFSLVSWEREPKQNPLGPLVSPGVYRAYGPIYRQLALLPRHRPVAAPAAANDALQEPFRVNYHVWKPGGVPFSKKKPPPPQFHIAVADTSSSDLPTLEQMEALLESTPLDAPGEAMQGPGRLYQRIKHGHRNVLVAVVDRGLVNFMRFGEGVFGDEKLYERFDSRGAGGRGGKKGGRGGRGGRGRGGRGRGRGGGSRGG
ncbi:hypothetical protein G6O67_002796 [Ophiocordyceps sinensis]|uniref:tRNA-splicing endonuclease subunit Sen54 N-terminal domain-containing protein n=1 Tax=Ophiocordyceps sinensis TaxID=72228 RepID=A0A8H4PUZ3_9HYPO|nr:hypothetical protein G6O67_002796 [Ophiocordyceps sinensis]